MDWERKASIILTIIATIFLILMIVTGAFYGFLKEAGLNPDWIELPIGLFITGIFFVVLGQGFNPDNDPPAKVYFCEQLNSPEFWKEVKKG